MGGVAYHRVTPEMLPDGTEWVFDGPVHLLLNLAVGGVWLGTPPADTAFPTVMMVDDVRVWRGDGRS